jgi:hypothetical protein
MLIELRCLCASTTNERRRVASILLGRPCHPSRQTPIQASATERRCMQHSILIPPYLFAHLPHDLPPSLLPPRDRTTSRAWTAILNDTEALAKDRQVFSELLISKVYDPLKTLASKKDEARKKVLCLHPSLFDYTEEHGLTYSILWQHYLSARSICTETAYGTRQICSRT